MTRAKIIFLFAVMSQLTACIASPRIEFPERLAFDYVMPPQTAMGPDDLLCCYQCNA